MDSECREQMDRIAPAASAAAIAAIERVCGTAAPADECVDLASPAEETWLRELFCKDALKLHAADAQLDAAITATAARLSGIDGPCRLAVCYLLAEQLGRLDVLGASGDDGIDTEPAHPAIGARGSAALSAAGDAVALVTGAPIASVGESIVQLGEKMAEGEARLADAITGHHSPGPPRRSNWPWVAIALVVLALLGWLLFTNL